MKTHPSDKAVRLDQLMKSYFVIRLCQLLLAPVLLPTISFAADGWRGDDLGQPRASGSCNGVAVPKGADAGESRSLSITGARYLLLQVTDACEGAGNGNLAAVPPGYSEAVEIRFIGTAVPVPSARRELMKRRRSRHGV